VVACPTLEELRRYLYWTRDGTLGPDQIERIESHIEACAACQGVLDRWTENDVTTMPPPLLEIIGYGRQGVVFGDKYELLEIIGYGRQGVVFKARHLGLQRVDALKMIWSGHLASADEIERFHVEAATIAEMRHPNIVKVYDFGKDRGIWYLSMELIEGGNLTAQLDRYKSDLRSATRLVATIARAVHHAHQRGIIYCDLKPSNVVIDPEGKPYLTDFGLAIKQLAEPESSHSVRKWITAATDVHGLGALLYTLLTGKAPFQGDSTDAVLEQVWEHSAYLPSRINPQVDRDLDAICLKCLEKEPRLRYGSADALANDLDRWLAGEPVLARPVGGAERLQRWCLRHPVEAALSTVAAGLLITATTIAFWVARAHEAELVREVCQSNLFEAKHVASRVLWELKTLSDPVEREANDRRLSKLMQQPNLKALQSYVKSISDKYKPANEKEDYHIQTWYVLDGEGKLLAVDGEGKLLAALPMQQLLAALPMQQLLAALPMQQLLAALLMQQSNIGKYYNRRDYFREALHHAKLAAKSRVHISRVFFSEGDQRPRFAFSAPVFADPDHRGRPLGIVVATTTTAAVLGSLSLEDGGRTVVVVGRREPKTTLLPEFPILFHPGYLLPEPEKLAWFLLPEFPILFHPGYPHQPGVFPIGMPGKWIQAVLRPRPNDECPGNEFRLSDSTKEEKVVDNYCDPLGIKDSKFGGSWLAAFVPVGDTELVVGVQQKYDKAVAPNLTLALDLFLGGGVAIALAVLMISIYKSMN
jgi:eukaryotic-like serine/threonine-protein kinase